MSALATKAIAGLVALLLVTGAYFAWASHERKLGAAEVEASNAEAIAMQNLKDAALNKKLAIALQVKVDQLEAIARKAGVSIDLQPVDPGSPADEMAAAAVNCMLEPSTCAK
jgi:hypothetical protein